MPRTLTLGCALVAVIAFAGAAAGGAARWPKPDARDKALLASVLHGMKSDLKSVRLTQLTANWRKGRTPGGLELMTTTSVSRKAIAASTKASWDSLLIAGAYNELCSRHADHCVRVNGTPNVGGPAGRSGAHRPYWSAHALTRAIRRAFAAAGLRVTSITFEHPNALAPIISVRSPHLAHALGAERKAWLALLPVLRHTEGSFIEMFGPAGRLIYVGAGSGNTGMGWCARVLKCPGTGAVGGP
jgi:hypothetical protein